MKTPTPSIATAVFLIGFSVAWVSQPLTRPTQTAQENLEDRSSQSRTTTRSPDGRENARIRSLVENLLEIETTHTRQIPLADYPALLSSLIARATPTGLDENEKKLLKKLLNDWYQASPDAAMEWVLSEENQTNSSHLLYSIIEHIARKDVEEAISFAAKYGAAQGNHFKMPHRLMLKLGEFDAESFLRVSASFTSRTREFSTEMEYADDFDFHRALDGLTAI